MPFLEQIHHFLSGIHVVTFLALPLLVLCVVALVYYLRLSRQLRQQFSLQQRISIDLKKLSTAVEESPASIIITDRDGKIEYVNPAFCRMTGYTAVEARGENPRILKGGNQPEGFYREMWDTLLAGREWRGEFHNKRKNGSLFWEMASISPIRDENGDISHFVAVKENVTERKELLERLDQLAHYDKLTGLPNRELFFDRLNYIHAISKRENRCFALLFVDLDGFKLVNDRYGHLAGDHVLKGAAERLTGCVRASDVVARMGGDQFIVILSRISRPQDARLVAEKILGALGQPFLLSDRQTCSIGASIGISVYPDDAQELTQLVSAADKAMYGVKRNGKHGWRFFGTEAGLSAENR